MAKKSWKKTTVELRFKALGTNIYLGIAVFNESEEKKLSVMRKMRKNFIISFRKFFVASTLKATFRASIGILENFRASLGS